MEFVARSFFHCSPEALFHFHEKPEALERLTPKWAMVKVVKPPPSLRVGSEAVLRLGLFRPLAVTWVARHTEYEPPYRFTDEQVKGPFRSWRHQHMIEAAVDGAILIDHIFYEPPLGLSFVAKLGIQPMLKRMFAFRHAMTRRAVEKGGV